MKENNNMEKIFTPEEIKSQTRYEKGISKIEKDMVYPMNNDLFPISNLVTFIQRKFGKEGIVTKEDIMRIDAELQSKAMDDINVGKEGSKEKLEKIKNSDIWTYNNFGRGGPRTNIALEEQTPEVRLEGLINKENIYIGYTKNLFANKQELIDRPELSSFYGYKNDKEISTEDAEKIWKEYEPIARERTKAVLDLINSREQEKDLENK